MKEIWEAHDEIVKKTPVRTAHWGVQKVFEEAGEFRMTDPDTDEEHFLEEGADVVLSWITTMKSAGISYEVAMEAVRMKLDIVVDRATEAQSMGRRNGQSWESNYLTIKQRE